MTADLERLEARLGHRFADRSLLVTALTHSSYANEQPRSAGPVADNERLEFLGDAVLHLAVAVCVVERLPDAPEGRLSTARAAVVGERGLVEAARVLGLGEALRLGRGEERTGGREKPSVLAGAYEALLGAVFADAGWDEALRVVRERLGPAVDRAASGLAEPDHKTRLQEVAQRRGGPAPRYVLARAAGPDHARTFEVEVAVGETVLGRGRGPSKKEAEQRAAEAALASLERAGAADPEP